MGIRLYNPYTAGTRNRSVSDFSEITQTKPEMNVNFLKIFVLKNVIIEVLLQVIILEEAIKDFIA